MKSLEAHLITMTVFIIKKNFIENHLEIGTILRKQMFPKFYSCIYFNFATFGRIYALLKYKNFKT